MVTLPIMCFDLNHYFVDIRSSIFVLGIKIHNINNSEIYLYR